MKLIVSDEQGMVMVRGDAFDYTLLPNMYRTGHGEGLQVNEGVDEQAAGHLCRTIADAVLVYRGEVKPSHKVDAVMAHLTALLRDHADANFEAGEHDRNTSDEPYEVMHQRAIAAEAALRAYVAGLIGAKIPASSVSPAV